MDASVDLYLPAERSTDASTAASVDASVPASAGTPTIVVSRVEQERRAAQRRTAPPMDRGVRESICEALIDSGSLALAAIDDTGLRFASPGFLRLLGLSSLQGESATSWCRRLHKADRERVANLLLHAMASGEIASADCLITEPGGEATRVRLSGYPAGPASPGAFTLLLHPELASQDIAPPPKLPAAVRRAFARGNSDVLDRAGDLLVDAWLKSEALAVLAVGVRAPAAGWTEQEQARAEDALLERLRPCLRDGDLLGRRGDEGLLIAIPNLSGACSAGIVAGRLIDTVGRSPQGEGERAGLAINIGIALFPDDDQELSGLLAHAGAALELAQQSGPNAYSLAETSLNLTLHPQPLPWERAPEVGLEIIDAHHRELIGQLRAFAQELGPHADPALLASGFARVRQALRADFAAEEAILQAHLGPGSEAHVREHERVLRNIDFLGRAECHQGIALSIRFLDTWLERHIREFDTALVEATYRPLW